MLTLAFAPAPVAASSGSSSLPNDLDWHGLLMGDIIRIESSQIRLRTLAPGDSGLGKRHVEELEPRQCDACIAGPSQCL